MDSFRLMMDSLRFYYFAVYVEMNKKTVFAYD